MGDIRQEFDLEDLRKGCFFIETPYNIYSRRLESEPIIGSGLIVPKRRVETVFGLDSDEWTDTLKLLRAAKAHLIEVFNPDGFSIGWNTYFTAGQTVKHAHLHVIPRFSDESGAGLGLRYWVRQGSARPDPTSKGVGLTWPV